MVGLLITVFAIALVDALNLSTIVSCAYLLHTPNPLRRTISYIVGVFSTYFSIGAALLIGFGDRINHVVDRAQSSSLNLGLKLAGGFVLIALASRHWIQHSRAVSPRPTPSSKATSAPTAFTLGVTMTLIDLTTAVPYIAALGIIARVHMHRVPELLLLLAYNLIYLIPAVALLLSWIRWGPGSVEAIERTRVKLSLRLADRRWAVAPGIAGLALMLWAAAS
jgi:cytochrome c biogenesis protein CcdA